MFFGTKMGSLEPVYAVKEAWQVPKYKGSTAKVIMADGRLEPACSGEHFGSELSQQLVTVGGGVYIVGKSVAGNITGNHIGGVTHQRYSAQNIARVSFAATRRHIAQTVGTGVVVLVGAGGECISNHNTCCASQSCSQCLIESL